jgi:hypothetical protein
LRFRNVLLLLKLNSNKEKNKYRPSNWLSTKY